MNHEKVGNFIAKLRKEQNMTQKDLADKLFITDRAVSKWERGLSMPDIGLLENLANYLEVSVIEILKGERMDSMTKENADKVIKESVPFFQKKFFYKKIKKGIMFIIIGIVSLIALFTIFAIVDYNLLLNGKKPMFTILRGTTIYGMDAKHIALNEEEYEAFLVGEYEIKDTNQELHEYIGLGYKLLACKKNCTKKVYFVPLLETSYDFVIRKDALH